MQNQSILYGVIGLLAGGIIGIAVAGYGVNSGNTQMMQMMGMGKGAQNMMKQDDIQDMMNGADKTDADKSSSITPEQHLAHHQ